MLNVKYPWQSTWIEMFIFIAKSKWPCSSSPPAVRAPHQQQAGGRGYSRHLSPRWPSLRQAWRGGLARHMSPRWPRWWRSSAGLGQGENRARTWHETAWRLSSIFFSYQTLVTEEGFNMFLNLNSFFGFINRNINFSRGFNISILKIWSFVKEFQF